MRATIRLCVSLAALLLSSGCELLATIDRGGGGGASGLSVWVSASRSTIVLTPGETESIEVIGSVGADDPVESPPPGSWDLEAELARDEIPVSVVISGGNPWTVTVHRDDLPLFPHGVFRTLTFEATFTHEEGPPVAASRVVNVVVAGSHAGTGVLVPLQVYRSRQAANADDVLFRDGRDGEWFGVAPLSDDGTYELEITDPGGIYGVRAVCADGYGFDDVAGLRATTAEVSSPTLACGSLPFSIDSFSVDVTNLGGGSGAISAGTGPVFVSGDMTVSVPVRPGPVDLLAARAIGLSPPDVGFRKPTFDGAAPPALALDFSAPDFAFAPDSIPLLSDPTNSEGDVSLWTEHGTVLQLVSQLNVGTALTFSLAPPTALDLLDRHVVSLQDQASYSGGTRIREDISYLRSAAPPASVDLDAVPLAATLDLTGTVVSWSPPSAPSTPWYFTHGGEHTFVSGGWLDGASSFDLGIAPYGLQVQMITISGGDVAAAQRALEWPPSAPDGLRLRLGGDSNP